MTVAIQFTPQGPLVPDFADILQEFKNDVFNIYGSDTDLDPDTQDGQLLAVFAQAMSDANQVALAVYQAFSPTTAQGPGLSSVVKINGLQRNISTASFATVAITGIVNTTITNGLVGDNQNLGTVWSLPPTVTIPNSGTINVIATCQTPGAVAANASTLVVILTPQQGWQTVSNSAPATIGNAVETDFALRQRQSNSVAITAEGPVDAIESAVANVTGVTRLMVYENTGDTTDVNGLISHSIAAVVQGGASIDIANAIASKKPAGCGMNGTTSVVVIDQKAVANTIQFYVLTLVTITVQITIKLLTGYVSSTDALIQESVAEFLSTLSIGEKSYLDRLYAPANLSGTAALNATGQTQPQLDALAATYNVVIGGILQARSGGPAASDVTIAFNEAAVATVVNITLVKT